MPASSTRRDLRLLSAFWFLRDFQLWIPVWIVFLTEERGFSLTQVTAAEGLFLAGMVSLEVPTGAVADRWGRSRSLALGALTLAASVLIFAFTTSFPVLLASFLLWSLAAALMSGADMALLFDTLKHDGRDSEFERFAGRGMAMSWAGAGIATLLGGPVAALTDIRTTIFIGAATCLGAMVLALAIHEPAHSPKAAEEAAAEGGHIREAFRTVWSNRELRVTVLLMAGLMAGIESVHYLTQPYLIDRGVEVGVWFSALQVPLFVAGIVGALLAPRLVARDSSTRPLVLGGLLGAAGCFALAATPGTAAFIALPLVVGMGGALHPIGSGYVNRRVDSARRATVLSISGMGMSVTMAVLAPVLGFATDSWGVWAGFAISGSVTAAALVLFARPAGGTPSAEGAAATA